MSAMNDLITDAIVEAATVASINVSLAPYGEAITATTDLQGGVEALAEMRAALKAVAPLIVAKALQDAADEYIPGLVDRGYMKRYLTARADRIKRGES